MKKPNIKNRIKRNFLAELAGQYFIDENSALVQKLIEENKDACVGIQNETGSFTVIGYNSVYYGTSGTEVNEMPINDILDILTLEAMANGKSHHYEFIPVNDGFMWVMNISTMNALWNTMLLLDTRPK